MLNIAGILIAVAIIIAIDVPILVRKKLHKELWLFSFLLCLGAVLGIVQALHIQIANPMDWMIMVYKPVADLIETWLK